MKKTISLFFCLIVLNVSNIFAYDSNPDSYSTFFSIKYDIPLYNHQEKKELPHESEPFLNLGIAYKPSVIPILFEIDMLSITGKNIPVVLGFSADYLFGNWPKINYYVNGYLGLGAGIDVYPTHSFLSTGPRIVTGIHFDISPFFLIFEPSAAKINLEFVYMPSYKMNTKNNISTIDPLNFKINFGLSLVFEGKTPVRKNNKEKSKKKDVTTELVRAPRSYIIDPADAINTIKFTKDTNDYYPSITAKLNMWNFFGNDRPLAKDKIKLFCKVTSDIDIPSLWCVLFYSDDDTKDYKVFGRKNFENIKAGIPFIIEKDIFVTTDSLTDFFLEFSYKYDPNANPATLTFEKITDTTDTRE